jgi:hypothetical protein
MKLSLYRFQQFLQFLSSSVAAKENTAIVTSMSASLAFSIYRSGQSCCNNCERSKALIFVHQAELNRDFPFDLVFMVQL